MRKTLLMRVISFAMCLCLIAGCMPMAVLADGLAQDETYATEAVDETADETAGEVTEGATEEATEAVTEEAAEGTTETATEAADEETPANDVAFFTEGENLAAGKAVTVSGGTGGSELTDGNIAVAAGGWLSEDLKSDSTEGCNQNPVWAVIDLENAKSTINSVVIQFRNNKVWATEYEIQTADTNNGTTEWKTVANVKRKPVFATLTQGEGQDIADEATYRDTITSTSNPKLEGTTVGRYVRVLVKRVNDVAPGHNVNIAEISVYGEEAPAGPMFFDDFEDGFDAGWSDFGYNLDKPGQGTPAVSEEKNHTADGKGSFKVGGGETDVVQKVWQAPKDKFITGEVSVWYYDTMSSDATLQMAFVENTTLMEDPAGDWPVRLGVGVYSTFGSGATNYMFQLPRNGNYTATNVTRTEGWHEFKFVCDGKKTTAFIDGTEVASLTTLTNFNQVFVGDHWPNSTKGVGYFDDVTIDGTVYVPPVEPTSTAKKELAKITEIVAPTAEDKELRVDAELFEGFKAIFEGSTQRQVVSQDGKILGTNIGEREVTMIVKVINENNPDDWARKNLTVTIPDHSSAYPQGWIVAQDGVNGRPGVVPSIQEWNGYKGNVVVDKTTRIVVNDGKGLGLDKVAKHMAEDMEEICGFKPAVVTGTTCGAKDIYLESADDTYNVGKEGYVIRTTADGGIRIYAPTYIGALYGTISVEQILWLADDHATVPAGLMRDFPAMEIRGCMLDVARTPYRMQQMYDVAESLLWYKINEWQVHLNDCDDSNFNGSTMDKQGGFHRLESKEFPSLKSDPRWALNRALTDHDYFENVYGNVHYTQEEYKVFQDHCSELGIFILNELDTPGHSLLYNKYSKENPDNIEWLKDGGTVYTKGGVDQVMGKSIELLDLAGPNAERATRFVATLWDEYTRGEDPVFRGAEMNIGTDEYWEPVGKGQPFLDFTMALWNAVHKNGIEKIRVWSGLDLNILNNGAKVPEDFPSYYRLDYWAGHADNVLKRLEEGYDVVNMRDQYMYGNPGRSRRDIVNPEWLYDNWDPTMFGNYTALKGDPHLLGAKTCLWGDQSREGMIERDVHDRIMRALPIVAEKTWDGAHVDSFPEFELRFSELAEGPNSKIAMRVDSETSAVLDYDFANVSKDGKTVYDASGNAYNGTVTGGKVEDGMMVFDGNTTITTDIKTVSYPYTFSFDIELSADDIAKNTKDSLIVSGYDGRLQVAGKNGTISGQVLYYLRDFHYTVPADTKVNVTMVGTDQGTKFYVDGKLVSFLSSKTDAESTSPDAMRNQELYSSFVLPLETIGENFHGKLGNIKVYNKALTPQVIAGNVDSFVNVAQDTVAGSQQYVGADQTENRMYFAVKAIDGDGFDYENALVNGDRNNNSEIFSAWKGKADNAYLVLDLGQTRDISKMMIQWKGNGSAHQYELYTSADGENWNKVEAVPENIEHKDTYSRVIGVDSVVALETPVEARFVKFQGVKRTGDYVIQEFMVFEDVDKTELEELLKKAEAIVAEKGWNFEKDCLGYYGDVVFGNSVLENPIATKADVEEAIDRLNEWVNDTDIPTHDLEHHEGKEPTCTEPGWKPYDTCKKCDYTTYEEIPAKGHDFEDGTCTDCGEKDPDYKPVDPTDPTDPEEKPGKPADEHKHVGDGAWVSDGKEHWHVCDCGDIIDKEAHTVGADGECTVCHKVLGAPSNGGNGSAQSPNTGDTMNVFPFVLLMGTVLAAAFAVLKRRERQN